MTTMAPADVAFAEAVTQAHRVALADERFTQRQRNYISRCRGCREYVRAAIACGEWFRAFPLWKIHYAGLSPFVGGHTRIARGRRRRS